MKKIIVILFIILLLFFNVTIQAVKAEEVSKYEERMKKIIKATSPSIVKVISENHKRYIATGIAIDADYVISNRVVIPSRYDQLFIRTTEGKEYKAKLVGKDRVSSIIMLKIDKKTLKPIKRARAGEVGDWVAVVGASYNEFPAIYHGFVSSVSKEEVLVNVPVVPGVSGAPVVNKNGELVAVVRGRFGYVAAPDYRYIGPNAEVLIRSSRSKHKELCYAMPVSKVDRISEDLKKYGKVRRGWLGVQLAPARNGVFITSVKTGSPAAKAGLRRGDLLLKLDGKIVRTSGDVSNLVRSLRPAQKVKIDLLRGEFNKSVLAVLGDADQYLKVARVAPDVAFDIPGVHKVQELPGNIPHVENYVFQFVGARTLGVDVVSINPELAKEFNVKEGKGLMISKVKPNSAANKAGIRPADIIVTIGEQPVANTADLRKVLNELENKESVPVTFYRKGLLKTVKVVPDNSESYGYIFDRFTDTLKNIRIRIDEENRLRTEAIKKARAAQRLKDRVSSGVSRVVVAPREKVDKKELEAYQAALDKMRKEQEELKKEMLKLKKMLEEKEKKEKEKKEKK
jgi:serine protease Do